MFLIDAKLNASGFFAYIRNPKRLAIMVRIMKKAQKQAWAEWLTRRQTPSLADRFDPAQAGRLMLSDRSENYRKRQTRDPALGRPTPYVSPRAGSRGASGAPHMRTLLLTQKRWRLSNPRAATGSTTVTTRMALSGARILNFLRGGETQRYLDEFMRLQHPAAALDAKWISKRMWQVFFELFGAELAQFKKRQIRKLNAA